MSENSFIEYARKEKTCIGLGLLDKIRPLKIELKWDCAACLSHTHIGSGRKEDLDM